MEGGKGWWFPNKLKPWPCIQVSKVSERPSKSCKGRQVTVESGRNDLRKQPSKSMGYLGT